MSTSPAAEIALLENYLVLGALLFGIGLVGLLSRRNMIVMFLCVEMMLQGVSLSLVAWGRFHNDLGGQMLVVFVVAVAACEAAIALALVLMLYHRRGKLDMALWQSLREPGVRAHVDRELPEAPSADRQAWPTLPAAGLQPTIPREKTDYRSHV